MHIHWILVGKPEGRNPHERRRCTWEDNMDGGAYTGSIWLRMGTSGGAVVNAVMNLRVP